jgi:RNA polymerase sigma-70 factor, ECF subfamily
MYALREPLPVFVRWNQTFRARSHKRSGDIAGIVRLAPDSESQRHAALIAAIASSKDAEAFGQLFLHFAPRLQSYLLRGGMESHLAEELAQDVMVMVWQKAHQYDPLRATAAAWIFGIASNLRIDRFRRNRITIPDTDPSDQTQPVPLADAILEADDRARRMRIAIGMLPPEQRSALQLAFFDDRSHAEIQSIQGISLGTIKSRLRLALNKLRTALKDCT